MSDMNKRVALEGQLAERPVIRYEIVYHQMRTTRGGSVM